MGSEVSIADKLERYEEAKACYLRAIELDPKDATPHNNLGSLYANKLERYEKAEACYLRAIELDPKFAYPHNGLGSLYADKLERYEEAKASCLRAIELAPEEPIYHSNLGELFLLRDQEQAGKRYKKACELDPRIAYGLSGLGWWHVLYGELAEAVSLAQSAREIDSKESNVLLLELALATWNEGWQANQAETLGKLEAAWVRFNNPFLIAYIVKIEALERLEALAGILKGLSSSQSHWEPWHEFVAARARNEGIESLESARAQAIYRRWENSKLEKG